MDPKPADHCSIEMMQEAILAAGWQFQEQVFNDGSPCNCMIDFSRSTDPCALDPHYDGFDADSLGWGRFPRLEAWMKAYSYIILGERRS